MPRHILEHETDILRPEVEEYLQSGKLGIIVNRRNNHRDNKAGVEARTEVLWRCGAALESVHCTTVRKIQTSFLLSHTTRYNVARILGKMIIIYTFLNRFVFQTSAGVLHVEHRWDVIRQPLGVFPDVNCPIPWCNISNVCIPARGW